MKKLIILGAGGYGRTVADVAQQIGKWDEIFFLDDNSQNAKVIGKCADFSRFIDADTQFYPAFGDNSARSQWLYRLAEAGCDIPTIVHGTAYVSPAAVLKTGAVVLPMAVVNTECVVTEGCIINCGAVIDHGCVIERCVHVCPGAVIKAENRIAEGSKIESGTFVQARTFKV